MNACTCVFSSIFEVAGILGLKRRLLTDFTVAWVSNDIFSSCCRSLLTTTAVIRHVTYDLRTGAQALIKTLLELASDFETRFLDTEKKYRRLGTKAFFRSPAVSGSASNYDNFVYASALDSRKIRILNWYRQNHSFIRINSFRFYSYMDLKPLRTQRKMHVTESRSTSC